MKAASLEKAVFVFSVMLITLCYGVAAGHFEWFPSSYLNRAADQARFMYHSWFFSASPLDTAPRVYNREGVRIMESGGGQRGATLLVSLWNWEESDGLRPGAKLIDQNGQTLHGWQINRRDLFPDSINQRGDPKSKMLHGSHLFPNGDLLLNLSYVGTVRVNSCGEVVWRLTEGNHHSIARAEDGSFWIPGASSERRTHTAQYPDGFPGIGKPIWLDQIVHVTEEGKILNTINVLDVLYENDLERHIVKGLGPYPKGVSTDPLHLNDVEPLSESMADEYPLFEEGDLLVSLRHISLVFVFDPQSGDVKWHSSHPFIHQHDPDFLGGGWIGVFDNNTDLAGRGKMLGGSRIIALSPHNDSVEVRFPTQHSEPFYTATRGSLQALENGNMLLAESRAGRVVEVDSEGRTAWEWVHSPHSGSRVPLVTGASRHNLTQNEVAAWPCSSVDSLDVSTKAGQPSIGW